MFWLKMNWGVETCDLEGRFLKDGVHKTTGRLLHICIIHVDYCSLIRSLQDISTSYLIHNTSLAITVRIGLGVELVRHRWLAVTAVSGMGLATMTLSEGTMGLCP
jgi:hypothetical protein